ncbi:histone deacetylase family protein [Prosthecomicrobium sp. N25]|uniref:histone deacetylase family protein n=1 Tax=Prosthecomicrobium sp. N25 TaxID=3129254 RepID=UPI003077ED66
MSTLLIHHPSFLEHVTPIGHPERPDRIRAIDRILEHERFQALEREQAPVGTIEQAALAHPEAFVQEIKDAVPETGLTRIDADTVISPGSWKAAMRGVGGVCQAVDEVMAGKVKNAFCAIRPPGHHAEKDRAMGFCLFNNVAVAARWAKKQHGVERVAIMDFDVHHGNGTQDIFWSDTSVMYTSTHQMPLYPGTGAVNETGAGNTIVNAPLRAGDGGAEFREAMEVAILPRIEDFRPDLVIISAGFDAHHRDPLGQINLVEADYAWVTAKLMDIADRSANGRVVSVLEGGYDLEGLAKSVAAHVMTLMKA